MLEGLYLFKLSHAIFINHAQILFVMSIYYKISDVWKESNKENKNLWHQRIIEWRKEPSSLRIERPTRLDRARAVGYKPKPGIIVVRQRLERGGRLREKIRHPRRSKHSGRRVDVDKSYRWVAEERAQKRHVNCEVINSYYVAEDGNYYWYEVILADRAHPSIVNDEILSGICRMRGRVYRGLTSAGKRSRGLLHKGKGAEKLRPSKTANRRRRRLWTNRDANSRASDNS